MAPWRKTVEDALAPPAADETDYRCDGFGEAAAPTQKSLQLDCSAEARQTRSF